MLRWCVGYLADDELVAFLLKAKCHLTSANHKVLRCQRPTSFILILDNVLEDGQPLKEVYGQTLRTAQHLERIFRRANLRVFKRSPKKKLHDDFEEV